jgi:hypothetical protein
VSSPEATPVDRPEIEVLFLRTGDEPAAIRRGWEKLEAATGLRGREALVKTTRPDESRPSIEHYRRREEIDLLLPVATT